MDELKLAVANFQFLRPTFLWLLLALPLLVWVLGRGRRDAAVWQRAVDPHLLPHLLQQGAARRSRAGPALLLLGSALSVLALAGPSWRSETAPLWQAQAPLVIALDLSAAMNASDLPPTRLAQARLKIGTLLRERRGGQVGLLVFAGDAFTVAPITRDAHTVQALLDSLTPDLMPVEGQRVDRAITRAVSMLHGAGFQDGDILLLSDHADSAAQNAAQQARIAGFRVSTLGVGTPAGAPVAGKQGFVTDADGQVHFARLDAASLAALASAGGGVFATLGSDDADLRRLDVLDPQQRSGTAGVVADTGAGSSLASATNRPLGTQRSDDGFWLLLLLLPLALLGFRRGWLAVFAWCWLGASALPCTPAWAAAAPDAAAGQTAEAAPQPGVLASAWDALWRRDDQRARAALDAGQVDTARKLARDPQLQGAAAYRGDDYQQAAKAWAGLDSADAHYNRGNALAKAGKLEDALAAYDQALVRAPGMADATANRRAVEEFLRQQQSQQQQSQQRDGQNQKDQDQKGQDQKGQDQKGQDQKGQDQKAQDQKAQDQKADQQRDGSQGKDGDQKQDGGDKQGADQKQDGGDKQGADQQQSAAAPKGDDPAAQNQAGSKPGDDPQRTSNDRPASRQNGDDKTPGKDQRDRGKSGNGDDQSDRKADAAKPDPVAEQQAREAEKREMQQALERAAANPQDRPDGKPDAASVQPMSAEQRAEAEKKQALQQWIRRVPDDPGGLLRRKFAIEYQRRQEQGEGR